MWVFSFFLGLWFERMFLEWKKIISKYSLREKLENEHIFTIRFSKKQRTKKPKEVYSDT